MTQCERIMDYLETHESISPMEAWNELGITKLATKVSLMIRAGVKIHKEKVHKLNRFGEPVWYMQYSLIREEEYV